MTMIRKMLYAVKVETNGPKKAVLKEVFDHPPTIDSLREAYKQASAVIDADVEAHVSVEASADEIWQEGIDRMRDELFYLDELISTIKSGGIVEAFDKGYHMVFVAGVCVGHIDIEKYTYLCKEG